MNNTQKAIIPQDLAVQSMRDNAYKITAYAVAELIDNSIQHGAKNVSLMCAEEEWATQQRTRTRLKKIGVLDNACGMDAEVLTMALQFGNGTHLNEKKRKGMGRFGMGLPLSSISQAKKVEVWTWQNGIENAVYSYLDVDEIINKNLKTVPIPISKEVPSGWLSMALTKEENKALYQKSGTLVVWSQIDRCQWTTLSI